MYGALRVNRSFDDLTELHCVNEELGLNRKPKILPWNKRPSILVRIVQNFFTASFDSGQPSRRQKMFQLNL